MQFISVEVVFSCSCCVEFGFFVPICMLDGMMLYSENVSQTNKKPIS